MTIKKTGAAGRWRLGAVVAATALLLAACGGGSIDTASAPVEASLKSATLPPAASPQAASVDSQAGVAAATRTFVVVLRDDAVRASGMAASAVQPYGGTITHVYTAALNGFAASVPVNLADDFVEAMQNDPNVDFVEADQIFTTRETVQPNATWGLDRSDQRNLPLDTLYTYTATGAGVRAFIIDTGIFPGHQDFGGRVAPGFSVINDGNGTNDCNGHGTHVAGTVGGATWGIAKQVTLVPVRVLSCSGSGSTSGVIAGLDWVTANGALPAVVNMSLGGGASSALDAAIARATTRGISVAVAAGNDNGNACLGSPARAPSALTVAASDISDRRASFSNFGTCVDLFAPGVSIRSATYNSPTGSSLKSGTSMASPHVAGLAALVLQTMPTATADQVSTFIKTTATPGKIINAGSGSPNLLIYTRGTGDAPPPPPPPAGTVSVGALSGDADQVRNTWRANVTIRVRTASGDAVPGALVQGGFTVGGSSASCTTAGDGRCRITSGSIARRTASTTFRVNGISGPGLVYDPAGNVATTVRIGKND